MNKMTPGRILIRAALLIACSVAGTVGVRGFIAYQCGVFRAIDVRSKLPVDARQQMQKYEQRQLSLKRTLDAIDGEFEKLNPGVLDVRALSRLQKTRADLIATMSKESPPVRVEGFLNSDTLYLWPLLYSSLLILIVICSPSSARPSWRNAIQILILASALFFGYRWPTYLRAFLPLDGRKIFAAANIDISRFYFFTQEATVFGWCALLAVVWWQWSAYWRSLPAAAPGADFVQEVCDGNRLDRMAHELLRWYCNSFILSSGFIVYTRLFWQYVVVYGDARYLFSAVVVHLLWGSTWVLMSMPVAYEWFEWHRLRVHAVASIVSHSAQTAARSGKKPTAGVPSPKESLEALEKVTPVPLWGIGATAIGAAATFVAPVVSRLF